MAGNPAIPHKEAAGYNWSHLEVSTQNILHYGIWRLASPEFNRFMITLSNEAYKKTTIKHGIVISLPSMNECLSYLFDINKLVKDGCISFMTFYEAKNDKLDVAARAIKDHDPAKEIVLCFALWEEHVHVTNVLIFAK